MSKHTKEPCRWEDPYYEDKGYCFTHDSSATLCDVARLALPGVENPEQSVKALVEAARTIANCPTVTGLSAHIRDQAKRGGRPNELDALVAALLPFKDIA